MEKFQNVLLNVWQEACRHIEISESTETISAILARHMPIERLFVRRINRQHSALETVAIGLAAPDEPLPDARTECSPAQMKKLLAWCKRGQVVQGGLEKGTVPPSPGENRDGPRVASSRALITQAAMIVPSGIAGEVLVGPLGAGGDQSGVLVLLAAPQRTFNARHMALMLLLLDPFSVALDNDHRLREMAALREAAEADRLSLLTRLGRKGLGDAIVGADSGLRAVMARVELVARSDAPVLIFGETGTGKELMARAIHARSARSDGPVIRINCGAIPPDLIDSELFGHERGAFTGAVEARKGWFERADGGTLFLDEIGELPAAAQVRLLRILQDGWLERVGGHQAIHVDVRVVAATHRDLAAMVADGKFREDLWYRIAVFPIVLPPLRERRQDIAELAGHFAERAAVRFGLPPALPSPEHIGLLESYAWPGNVRELATVIDRAVILGDGQRLDVATALGITNHSSTVLRAAPKPPVPGAHNPPNIAPLDVAIREHIEKALAVTKGRIEGLHGAAVLLNINPHTLRAKMRKLGIDWRRFRQPAGSY